MLPVKTDETRDEFLSSNCHCIHFFIPFIKALLKVIFLIMARQVLKPAGALAWSWGSAGLARGCGSGVAAAERLEGRNQTPESKSTSGVGQRLTLHRARPGRAAPLQGGREVPIKENGCRASANGIINILWFITWLSGAPWDLQRRVHGALGTAAACPSRRLCVSTFLQSVFARDVRAGFGLRAKEVCSLAASRVPCTSERVPHLLSPNQGRRRLTCKACLVVEKRLTWVPGAKCAQSLKHGLAFLGCGLESSAPSLRSSSLCCSAKETELFLAGAEPQLSSFLCSPETS